ncbi:MAG: C-terminal binding protein [Chloroflexota bacterium]|nr:MAG: C-terminal binding protein [Chloroflexota bacterium]
MNAAPVVPITDYVFPNLDPEHEVLGPLGVDLRPAQCKTPEEVAAHVRGADALLVCYAPVPAEVVAQLEGCRIIARYGIGVDNVDVEAATSAGIVVTNVPDYCIDEVSDHALALILALSRKVAQADRRIRAGEWSVPGLGEMHRLRERTLGLVGMGKIPRALVPKAQALGLAVVSFDPYFHQDDADRMGIRLVSLETLLRSSDIISLHAPLTDETREMINAQSIALMKPGVLIVNTARGPLVDIPALVEALQSGQVGAAGLDVLPVEPPPPGSPLLSLENVILTPHAAFSSTEAIVELQTKAAEEVARALRGQRPRNPVNPGVLGKIDWLKQ